jgi:hypothetical protein
MLGMTAITPATPGRGSRSSRVSGSSETKTYGKGATRREHEEQHTLPRRSFFGKVLVGREEKAIQDAGTGGSSSAPAPYHLDRPQLEACRRQRVLGQRPGILGASGLLVALSCPDIICCCEELIGSIHRLKCLGHHRLTEAFPQRVQCQRRVFQALT